MTVLCTMTPYITGAQPVYRKGATRITVSWFAGCMWKNNSKRYTQLPILFHNFCSVHNIHKHGHGLHITGVLISPWSDLLPYTGCHRRNGPNFGRVFLMLNYTDITQNTYVQS